MEAVVRPRRIVRSSVAKYSEKPMTATKQSKIINDRAKQTKSTGWLCASAAGNGMTDADERNLRA